MSTGAISLVAWSLTLMVSTKFVLFIMRANNAGEGGVMALYALVGRATIARWPVKIALLTAGVVGVALFFADAMITPAISVLSAVEGVEVAAPSLSSIILPCTIAAPPRSVGCSRRSSVSTGCGVRSGAMARPASSRPERRGGRHPGGAVAESHRGRNATPGTHVATPAVNLLSYCPYRRPAQSPYERERRE